MNVLFKIKLVTGFLLLSLVKPLANDSIMMGRLLQRIHQLQSFESSVFPKGMFPSYRIYALNKDRQKADINPFFTGLISFTLEDVKQQLSLPQQKQADEIIACTFPVFAKFKNPRGRNTYNFWPTDTPKIFPNAGWINLFDKSQSLPDDLDDTVIILLALSASQTTAKEVHAIMQSFTNNGQKQVKNTFKGYRNIGAYSTWFGKKMPVDFDVCVLANILYFVQKYNLEWTAADSASLHLIEKVITEKKHISDAAYVSPHYSKLPNILYHISRLMSVKNIPSLEKLKPQLIKEAQDAMLGSTLFMDDVMLSTSLLRWGINMPVSKRYYTNSIDDLVEDESFSFFIANMASMLPDPLKQWMGGIGLGKFYYYCPAYNNLLLLENLGWRKEWEQMNKEQMSK